MKKWHMSKPAIKQLSLDLLKILGGTLLGAASFRYLTYPNNIVAGGITGIAQTLNMLIGTPVGLVIIVLNIPLFLLARKKLGPRFVALSLVGMLGSSVFIDVLEKFPFEVTNDPLLAAVYGGLLGGFGWGLLYTTGSSGGGIDIPVRLLRRKYPYINFGTLQLAFNAVIIVAFAVIFRKFDSCMYTVICMFIGAKVEDVLLYGPLNARLCHIISDKSEELRNVLNVKLKRGVTILHGEGSWSRAPKQVLMCVVKKQQIADLRRYVREVDSAAFLIISEAGGVYGRGFHDIEQEE